MSNGGYGPLSGLGSADDIPANWALGFCISNWLIDVGDGSFAEAFEAVFNGPGSRSEDGWELCRWPRRIFGKDVEASHQGNGFLAWTDPEDHGFEPSWKIYEEEEFKRILARAVERHLASGVGAKRFEVPLRAALQKYRCEP